MNYRNLGGCEGSSFSLGYSGIASKKPVWKMNSRLDPLLGNCLLTDNELFIGSAGRMSCFSPYSGEIIWETGTSVWDVEHYGENLAVADKYVMSGWCLLDRETGSILLDMKAELGIEDSDNMGVSFPNFFIDGIFYRYVENEDKVFRINPESREVMPIPYDGYWYFNSLSSDSSLAFMKKQEGKYGVLDLENDNFIWCSEVLFESNNSFRTVSIDQSFAYFVSDKWKGIWKVDLLNGEHHELVDSKELKVLREKHATNNPIFSIALAPDVLYTAQNKRITAFDKEDGKLLFESAEFDGGVKSAAGQGDVIFFVSGEGLMAIDRYTGEKVWQADEGMTAAYHVMTGENRVYFSNTLGEIRCYEWDEPYHSPAKP